MIVLCASCAYFGYLSDPYDENYVALKFDGGKIWVSNGECPSLNDETREVIKDWSNRAWNDLREAGFRPSILGDSDKKVWMRGQKITEQGKYSRKQRLITYRCDKPHVVRHELFHAWCYIDEMPCDCFWIDHPEGTKIEDCHA